MGESQQAFKALSTAVRWRKLHRVKELLDEYGLHHFTAGIKERECSLLFGVVREDNIENAKLLFKSGLKVNLKDSGSTALHFAVDMQVEMVKVLLENKAAVNATNSSGSTPLHCVLEETRRFCNREFIDIIDLLLSYGADVNACDNKFVTPLNYAVKHCSIEIVEKLIRHCEDINIVKSGHSGNLKSIDSESGYTSLHYAIVGRYRGGNQDIVEILLRMGADVNIRAQNGKTALHMALFKGDLIVAESLINHGADIHSVYNSGSLEGYTPLHVLFCISKYSSDYNKMKENRKKIIEILLDKGANINASSKTNMTPLYVAITEGYNDEAMFLLEHGADPNAVNDDGKSILCVAVEKGCFKFVEHILKNGIYVKNERDSHMVRVALLDGNPFSIEVVETLLTYGFSVAEEVHYGDMFYAALKKRCKAVVVELLKVGFDVNKQYTLNDGKSFLALHEAVRFKSISVARLLINYGADVNAEDKDGNTAIYYLTFYRYYMKCCHEMLELLLKNLTNTKHYSEIWMKAIEINRKDIFEVLLDKGFDVDMRDTEGCTALHHAVLGGPYIRPDLEVVKLLLSRGADVNAKTSSGLSVLHLGVVLESHEVELFHTLLDYNPDVNVVCCDGVTPLHLYAFRGNYTFCQLLVNKGAEVNANLKNNKTALHVAVSKYPCSVAFKNFSEVMLSSNLLKQYHNTVFGNKSKWGFRSEGGFKHPVERMSDVEIIDILIDCGAAINAKDDDGKTALHYAAENPLSGPLKALIKRGADIMARDNVSKTPLHCVGFTDKAFLRKFTTLVSCGVDINSRDIDGTTVLHKSVQARGTHMRTFLNLGCDINALNNNNLTPFQVALDEKKNISLTYHVMLPLSEHVIKLKAVDRYVHRNNLIVLDSLIGDDFHDRCKRELTAMKSQKVGVLDLSYYDIIKKSRNKLVGLAKQVDIEKALEEDNFSKFPIYGNDLKLILVNLKKAARRNELLDLSCTVFDTGIASLPIVCVELILGYLSDIDLINLIRVYHSDFAFPGRIDFFCDDEDDLNVYNDEDSICYSDTDSYDSEYYVDEYNSDFDSSDLGDW